MASQNASYRIGRQLTEEEAERLGRAIAAGEHLGARPMLRIVSKDPGRTLDLFSEEVVVAMMVSGISFALFGGVYVSSLLRTAAGGFLVQLPFEWWLLVWAVFSAIGGVASRWRGVRRFLIGLVNGLWLSIPIVGFVAVIAGNILFAAGVEDQPPALLAVNAVGVAALVASIWLGFALERRIYRRRWEAWLSNFA